MSDSVKVDAGPLEVVVHRITSLTPSIKEFELRPAGGTRMLPPAEPGGHIKVETGNGQWRAYSVVNHGDTERYVIAVKLRGGFSEGSQFMHDFVGEGDVLNVMPPQNGFAMAQEAVRAVLIAGGIGITPIISLARSMKTHGVPLEFHYLGEREGEMAYADAVRDEFGAGARLYFTAEQGKPALRDLVGAFHPGTHLYVCGPESLLLDTRKEAVSWPPDNVHYELFLNPPDSPAAIAQPAYAFEIELARSGKVLAVPADKTILDVLTDVGIHLPSVCRAGFCGTCVVPLLEGEAEHRDTVLSEEERKDRIQTCCSRAPAGARLVLDR
ncbi:PDR/VanB family oxidoreductase [Paracidovorax wautersii]|jgi:ferredoxin-NADP reductase|uniref:Ferredoxin-NADP reductase n=1 Tax=Paracidovorax wautersii TaxID=1177982 RepID=A0A1I2DZ08_9BURK|nr:PDR/VanB family oxidoreductase [Paracidovorax wautersii]SFE85865.1 Ferredoxin-NADP reductase [Paracidovorax wautersii]